MIPPDRRHQVVQGIWRRAPSLPLRLKNLRRAEQLIILWRAHDRKSEEAAGNR
jgi:hypothetical protein